MLKKLEFERIVSSHLAMVHEPQVDEEEEERELLHLSSIDHLSLDLVEDRAIGGRFNTLFRCLLISLLNPLRGSSMLKGVRNQKN
jgi:rRNA pseudouridine-1189 N-methylase Emg1 (Nep1/Mra1 family)